MENYAFRLNLRGIRKSWYFREGKQKSMLFYEMGYFVRKTPIKHEECQSRGVPLRWIYRENVLIAIKNWFQQKSQCIRLSSQRPKHHKICTPNFNPVFEKLEEEDLAHSAKFMKALMEKIVPQNKARFKFILCSQHIHMHSNPRWNRWRDFPITLFSYQKHALILQQKWLQKFTKLIQHLNFFRTEEKKTYWHVLTFQFSQPPSACNDAMISVIFNKIRNYQM